MSENNTPTNEDASSAESPSGVLDTSDAGGPHIPKSAPGPGPQPPHSGGGSGDPPDSGGGAGHPQPVPDDEELVIEVEFAPEVENIDDLLASINIPEPSGGPSSETDFANVVRTHGLVDAQPVFTREDHEKERTRVHTLRESIPGPAEGGGGYEKLRQWEQLPPLSHYVQLRFPPGTSADAVIAKLRSLPQVKRAVVVTEAVPPSFPTDEMIGTSGSVVQVDPQTHIQKQWYLHRTRVPQAWQFGRGANVVVADVDFGCHVSHRELVGAIEHTHNSFDGTEDVTSGERAGHGTAVLGIVGARADGSGLAGYAPDAKLWVIQGNTGTSPRKTNTPWSDGIKHVLDTGSNGRRKVLLVEVETGHDGNAEQWPSVQRLVQQAIAENHVVCVAAGNGNRDANHDDSGTAFEPTGSILVGATRFHATENIRAGFSNFGPGIVVSAPGDEFHDVTCGPSGDDSYRNKFGGTSGAAAKVAGTVALMLSVNPKLTHDEVRDILRDTGSPITPDSNPEKPIGVFLNAEAAVLEARNRLDN